MKCYRLYTEECNIEWLKTVIAEKFASFTIYHVTGHFERVEEQSIVVEIITDNPAAEHYLQLLALKIKGYNRQDEVLITKSEVEII